MDEPPTSARPGSIRPARTRAPFRTAPAVFGRYIGSAGQSTVEYALVLLGAAALALLLVSWATGTDVIGRLFDAVLGRILQKAG